LEVTVQILTGGFTDEPVPYELIEQKLLSALSKFSIKKVLMGWATEKEVYLKTAEFLTKRNIEFYLWFPVFSETGSVADLAPLVDFTGKLVQKPEAQSHDFFFFCPNSRENINKILNIYNQYFSSIPFTGIFLDRIRYPSFANGNALSCFCPECLDFYNKKKFDVDRLIKNLSNKASFVIKEYRGDGEYIFEDPVVSEYFKLKSAVINKSMQQISGFFREKNLGVGFDVFASYLSPFVGQNLTELSGLCDFIKPMVYRATTAPAGLPFETDALLNETGNSNIHGVKSGKMPFDLAFAARDLQIMTASSACPVYAGIEINRVDVIAEVYPNYIEETMKAYSQTGIRGFALSWNLLEVPDDNLTKAAELVGTG